MSVVRANRGKKAMSAARVSRAKKGVAKRSVRRPSRVVRAGRAGTGGASFSVRGRSDQT